MTKDEHRQRLIIKVGEQWTVTLRLQMVVDELASESWGQRGIESLAAEGLAAQIESLAASQQPGSDGVGEVETVREMFQVTRRKMCQCLGVEDGKSWSSLESIAADLRATVARLEARCGELAHALNDEQVLAGAKALKIATLERELAEAQKPGPHYSDDEHPSFLLITKPGCVPRPVLPVSSQSRLDRIREAVEGNPGATVDEVQLPGGRIVSGNVWIDSAQNILFGYDAARAGSKP